jgi:phosphatidylinositol alpha-1,6-mannosyltransferase
MELPRSGAVLALVTEAFGATGGIAQYNRDFLTVLAASPGVSSVTVLARRGSNAGALPAGVVRARARNSRLGYSLAALVWAVSRPIDIVFCGHLFMAPLAAFIARLKRAKLVMQAHGIEAWPRPSRPQRAAAEAADLILCVSRHTRARVLGWCAIAPERVVVLPNTVAPAFRPGESSLRSEWGLAGKRVLLTVGRLDPRERYKGHDRVIAALPHLVREGFDVVYVVLGEGEDRARLEALARNEGVLDRVRFTGAAAPETLVAAYRMADLFVMPSTGEGFGIAFLEAMACGTPSLGLAEAGAPDALGEGDLGSLTVEAGLPAAIARMLSAPRPVPASLSEAVLTRFGPGLFRARAAGVLQGLMEAA